MKKVASFQNLILNEQTKQFDFSPILRKSNNIIGFTQLYILFVDFICSNNYTNIFESLSGLKLSGYILHLFSKKAQVRNIFRVLEIKDDQKSNIQNISNDNNEIVICSKTLKEYFETHHLPIQN